MSLIGGGSWRPAVTRPWCASAVSTPASPAPRTWTPRRRRPKREGVLPIGLRATDPRVPVRRLAAALLRHDPLDPPWPGEGGSGLGPRQRGDPLFLACPGAAGPAMLAAIPPSPGHALPDFPLRRRRIHRQDDGAERLSGLPRIVEEGRSEERRGG